MRSFSFTQDYRITASEQTYNGGVETKTGYLKMSKNVPRLNASRSKEESIRPHRIVYENSLLTDVFPSWFFFSTFATANSKSSCVTCCLRSRNAYMPSETVGKCSRRKKRRLTRFSTYTPDFCARALAHLLRQRSQVDTTL